MTVSDSTSMPHESGPRPGTARAALAYRDFRIVWIGSFASNVGTWMQTVVLSRYAYDISGKSAAFVGIIVLAQLGPLLLSPLGGLFADRFPRRQFLIACQTEQLVFSFVLAGLAAGHPAKLALVAVVLAIGVGNALNAPAWSAALPALVGPRDLPGAIALNSTVINGSRVLGPIAVALAVGAGVSAAGVFAINAVTYVFVVIALAMVHINDPHRNPEQGLREIFGGFREARRNRLVGRILLILPIFSILCLPYVGQFPTVADRNFGIDPQGATYGWLYATWGVGAVLGGLSIATVFAHSDKRRMPRRFLVGFAASLALFAEARGPSLAFPAGLVLGFCYFGLTTSMLTVLQQHISDEIRGRVMALWFMGFGGSVAISQYPAGWLMDRFSVTPVLLVGAVTALALSPFTDFVPLASGSSAVVYS